MSPASPGGRSVDLPEPSSSPFPEHRKWGRGSPVGKEQAPWGLGAAGGGGVYGKSERESGSQLNPARAAAGRRRAVTAGFKDPHSDFPG